MTDQKPIVSLVPQREDGPRIAAFLNGIDGGQRPTNPASAVGVHLAPEAGLVPAVPGKLIDIAQAPREATAPMLEPAPAADSSDEQGTGDIIDVGPIHYAHKLHECGEGAIAIVSNMCEAEFAMGNPRNLPEPILGWYNLTLTYQLLVLEACGAAPDVRSAHARQLAAARAAFVKYAGAYASAVRAEVDDSLGRRKHWGTTRDDGTYGGILPAPESVS